MREYNLMPKDGHKSFYGKARVIVDDSGAETLISYRTPVLRRNASGELVRLWGGWSATTGRHIAAFAGINKKEWDRMEVERKVIHADMTPAESYRAMIARRMIG